MFGDRRGDELPPELACPTGRFARLRAAKERLDDEDAARRAAQQAKHDRRAAAREAGHPMPGRAPAAEPPSRDQRNSRANTTDPDSRLMTRRGGAWVQGYNAQLVVTGDQIALAGMISQHPADVTLLHPMLTATRTNLDAAGVATKIRTVLADTGYCSEANLTTPPVDKAALFIPLNPDRTLDGISTGKSAKHRPPKGSAREKMRRKMGTARAKARYRQRSCTVEPAFGQIKARADGGRLLLRGLTGAELEWQLMLTAHNLKKLWRSRR